MRNYRVTLPIEIDGVAYQFGDTVKMDTETAVLYAHALIAIEEGEGNGGNS